jgi:Na+/H+ antiporter NhaD/arsenite permease-like protein
LAGNQRRSDRQDGRVNAPSSEWLADDVAAELGEVARCWISSSLAGLLWADVMARHVRPVTPVEYARVGVRLRLSALVMAGAVVVGLGRLT